MTALERSVISNRVVLDPARLRQDLRVLELVPRDFGTLVVEDHEPGAGGALVEGADELWHGGEASSRAVPVGVPI